MIANIKNEIYEILQNEADSMSNLKLVDNTRGMNGYPERMSWSIIGFRSIKELEKVEQELLYMLKETVAENTDKENLKELEQLDVHRQILHKRDGWNLWEVQHEYYILDEFDMCEIMDDCNSDTFLKSRYDSEYYFIESEINDLDLLRDCTTFDELQDVVSKYREMWESINSLKDDEILIRYNESWTFEKMKRYATSYSKDTHTYAIALSIL